MTVLIYFLQAAVSCICFLGIAWAGIAAGRWYRDKKIQKKADR